MDTALGFLGVIVWIVSVIALAAAVTYLVVKLSPGDKRDEPDSAPNSQA